MPKNDHPAADTFNPLQDRFPVKHFHYLDADAETEIILKQIPATVAREDVRQLVALANEHRSQEQNHPVSVTDLIEAAQFLSIHDPAVALDAILRSNSSR